MTEMFCQWKKGCQTTITFQPGAKAEKHKNSCSIKIQPTTTCFTQNQTLFYGKTVKYCLKTLLNNSNLTICVASTNMFASLSCTESD